MSARAWRGRKPGAFSTQLKERERQGRLGRRIWWAHTPEGFADTVREKGVWLCAVTLLPTSECECYYMDPQSPGQRWPDQERLEEYAYRARQARAKRRRLARR